MKKFFSLVLALVMALSLTTVAWGANEAKIVETDTEYATVEEAVSNATAGQTVLMLTEATVEATLVVNGITLDGNGKTLHAAAALGSMANDVRDNTYTVIKSNDGCTIKNLTVKGGWKGILIEPTATQDTLLENVTVVESCRGINFNNIADSNVKLTVKNSTLGGWCGVQAAGPIVFENTTFVKNAGVRDSGLNTYDGLTLNNCTFAAGTELTNEDLPDTDVITINGGTYACDFVDEGAGKGTFSITGGTFTDPDAEDYLADGLELTADGVVVSEGGAVLGTKYDMVTTDIAQTKTTGVTVNTYSAKSPKDTNKDGKLDQVGNVQYVEFSNMPGRYFVQVATVGKADYTVYHTGTKSVFGYFAEVVSPFYLGNGVAFYDFGENCGQYDDTPAVGAKYYLFQGVLYVADATELSDVNLKVGSDLVSVIELPDEWVGHVPAFTYDKDYKIVGVKCAECGTPAVIYPNYDSVPKAEKKAENVYGPINTIEYYCWLAGPSAVVDTETKVESAETFDAGIAMYVGMSVMAAAGSAVVIGKKKD